MQISYGMVLMHICTSWLRPFNHKLPGKCEWSRKPALKIGLNRQTSRL